MTPLTERLLHERTARLFASLPADEWEHAIEAVAVVVCDGCGYRIDLLAEPLPPGWTTEGSHAGGWFDLCRRCSQ